MLGQDGLFGQASVAGPHSRGAARGQQQPVTYDGEAVGARRSGKVGYDVNDVYDRSSGRGDATVDNVMYDVEKHKGGDYAGVDDVCGKFLSKTKMAGRLHLATGQETGQTGQVCSVKPQGKSARSTQEGLTELMQVIERWERRRTGARDQEAACFPVTATARPSLPVVSEREEQFSEMCSEFGGLLEGFFTGVEPLTECKSANGDTKIQQWLSPGVVKANVQVPVESLPGLNVYAEEFVPSAAEDATPARVASLSQDSSSLYLPGEVEGVKNKFLVDTGAESSVISLRLLQRLPKLVRTRFQDATATLRTANGKDMPAKGPVTCKVTVNERSVLDTVYAADIDDEAIMGLSTLRALQFEVTVAGKRLRQVKQAVSAPIPEPSKVFSTATVKIPPRSRLLISARIDAKDDIEALVGPRELTRGQRLAVARAIVKPVNRCCMLQMLNPHDEAFVVQDGEWVAVAEQGNILEIKDPTTKQMAQQLPDHLHKIFADTVESENLSEFWQTKLCMLLRRHAELFAVDDGDLGRTDLVLHDIDTGDARPIRQPPRRAPTALKDKLDEEIDSMLQKGVIEHGQSPWASPVVLVAKKDGSLRFCVDYRRLNSLTRFDAYPIPGSTRRWKR